MVKQHRLPDAASEDAEAPLGGLPGGWSSIAAGIHLLTWNLSTKCTVVNKKPSFGVGTPCSQYCWPVCGAKKDRISQATCDDVPPQDVQWHLRLWWNAKEELDGLPCPRLQVVYSILQQCYGCIHKHHEVILCCKHALVLVFDAAWMRGCICRIGMPGAEARANDHQVLFHDIACETAVS